MNYVTTVAQNTVSQWMDSDDINIYFGWIFWLYFYTTVFLVSHILLSFSFITQVYRSFLVLPLLLRDILLGLLLVGPVVKYFVGPLLTLMTASTRRGMLWMRVRHASTVIHGQFIEQKLKLHISLANHCAHLFLP